jgi:hypothetical protein
MIRQVETSASDATRRAEMIYAQARSQIDGRLWRAALGSDVPSDPNRALAPSPPLSITAMISLFADSTPATPALPLHPAATAPAATPAKQPAMAASPAERTAAPATAANGLGQNAGFSGSIARAADRAGIPAAVLASIIDAEAAKTHDGRWLPNSRNARSTATGLGQFLAGTWKAEAERAGTWLNATARSNGWIGAGGKIVPDAQAALLALRNDTTASINATADFAQHSLAQLARAGVSIGRTVEQIAEAAYLGHNLGIGDAIGFLRGGLSEGRARHLLDAQVGSAAAARRIVAAGGASAAHHHWLTEFMAKRVNPGRFFS